MRPGSFVSLCIALVFGALAVVLARGLLAGAPSPASSRTVVVASTPLAFGTPLTAENLREMPWPTDAPVDGAFASIAELTAEGRRLSLAPLQRNEPVLLGRITGPNGRATLSTQIDGGMRAVSVRVDEVRGVAGFVLPGDNVDVVLTRGEGGSQDAAAYADILIQNAKVLAIDQLAYERGDKPSVARAVTLELSVAEAQKVILAQGIGRLSLILRQAGEGAERPTQRITAGDLGIEAGPQRDRIAELEKQLAESRLAAEQASSQASEGVMKRMAEIEARLRGEMATARPAAAPPPAPPAPVPTVVNVTRNGAKREPYTVTMER